MADPRVKARFEVSGQNGIVDEFKKTEKAAKDSADNIQQRYASLKSGLVALGIGTAIGVGLRAMIKNTAEAEMATRQLEQVLKATGGAAGLTKQQLLDMASGLQAVTTYGDEAIIEAQKLLLTFKSIGGEVFPRALEAVLDMSTTMGTDLKGSAIQLGKALNDPIKGVAALGEVGVQFTDKQKGVIEALVETGRVADAQRLILVELEGQMGGTARTARDTLGGAYQALWETIGDLTEGDASSPGLQDARQAIEDLNTIMGSAETKAAAAALTEGIFSIAGAAAEALAGLVNLTKFIAEEMAATFNGIDSSDRVRLDERLQRLRKDQAALESSGFAGAFRAIGVQQTLSGSPLEGSSIDLFSSIADNKARIAAEIASIEALLNAPLDIKPTSIAAPQGASPGGGVPGNLPTPRDRDAERKAEAAARKAAREEELRIRAIAIANAELGRVLDEQAAVMGGPMVEAAQRYRDELVMLDEIEKTLLETRALTVESQAQLNLARESAAELYQEEMRAIEAQLTPNEELLEAMRFELELLGMTNEERRKAILLRQLDADATDAQKAELLAIDQALADGAEKIRAKDEFRDMFASALADAFKTGDVKGAIEGLGDAIHNAVSNRLADSITDWLFGQQGSSGGGVFDSIASWFGTLFGGGRAIGGPVEPGRFYEVGENNRPELLHTAGRTWLIPGNRGAVEPMGGAGVGGDTYHMSFSFPMQGRMDRRSALQAAAAVGQQVRLSGRNA